MSLWFSLLSVCHFPLSSELEYSIGSLSNSSLFCISVQDCPE